MASEQPNLAPNPYADLFKAWTANPFTASWVVWQRYMWMSNPLSKLFPVDAEEMWTAFVNMGQDLAARPELLQERTTDLLRT